MKEEEVASLRVADLKEELKSRGLSTTGLKAMLATRLLEAIREEAPAAEEAPEEDHEVVKKDTKEASGAVDTTEKSAPADSSANPAQTSAETVDKPPEDTKSKAKDPAAEVAPQGQQGPDIKDTAAATTEEAGDALSDGCKGNVTNQTGKESAGVTLEPVEAEQTMPAETEGDGDKASVEEDRPGSDHQPRDADAQEDTPETAAVAEVVPRQPDEAGVQVAEVTAPVPVTEPAEEEVDYEADDVDMVTHANEEPSSKADAEEQKPPEAPSSRKRPSERDHASDASKLRKTIDSKDKAHKAQDSRKEGDARRKHDPIPLFVPRDRRSTENGDRTKDAELARSGSNNDKRSVFQRLNSGAGKDAADEGGAVGPKRAPPSREAPSRALLITGFIRPFTEKQAREKLSETGEITGFWMTRIKDRAYVVYATEEQAEATRHAVTGIEWPLGNANSLRPKFVSVEDAEETIKTGVPLEARRQAPASAPANARASADPPAAAAPRAEPISEPALSDPNTEPAPPAAAKALDARAILEERRKARVAKQPAADPPQDARADPAPMEVERPTILEDLFCKTTTKPWLYWLPLTEEQAAEKAKREHEAKAKASSMRK